MVKIECNVGAEPRQVSRFSPQLRADRERRFLQPPGGILDAFFLIVKL
jgi:hypothetical protein